MSHEHRLAIERIITLCESARQPTRRIERIYDIALESAGLTFNQRQEKIKEVMQKSIQIQRDRAAARVKGNQK